MARTRPPSSVRSEDGAGKDATGIREHYLALDKNASDCIGCGSCEPNYPFGVKIVERMEETAELFA